MKDKEVGDLYRISQNMDGEGKIYVQQLINKLIEERAAALCNRIWWPHIPKEARDAFINQAKREFHIEKKR